MLYPRDIYPQETDSFEHDCLAHYLAVSLSLCVGYRVGLIYTFGGVKLVR